MRKLSFLFSILISACAPLDPNLMQDYLKVVISQAEVLKVAILEVPGIENIKIQKDGGVEYLELRLYPLQPLKNNGIRAEISIDFPFKEGDTLRYSWEFKVPSEFPSDAPKNRWWVFADWHVQPDTNLGETWDNYSGAGSPIQFGYGMLEGKDLLSLAAGTNQGPVGLIPFTREVWHTVRCDITWSQKTNGKLNVYFDGATTPTLSTNCENMRNAVQHYLKIGQYRNREIFTENKIGLRNILIHRITN